MSALFGGGGSSIPWFQRKFLGFNARFQGTGSSVGELNKRSARRAVSLPFNLHNLRLIVFQPQRLGSPSCVLTRFPYYQEKLGMSNKVLFPRV